MSPGATLPPGQQGAGSDRVIYTIGHSNRDLASFVALLRASGVGAVADVRAFPHSRSMPWFEGAALRDSLAEAGIAYRHFPRLGGRRPHQPGVDPARNAYWQNRSFHNYADYALGEDFAVGLMQLDEFEPRPCAVLCAEAVWWRCHRRIIADHLLVAGWAVFHILGPDAVELARLTDGAQAAADGRVSYPEPSAALAEELAQSAPGAP